MFRSQLSIANYPLSIVFCALVFSISCNPKKTTTDQHAVDSAKVANPSQFFAEKIKADSLNPELYFARSQWYLSDKKLPAAQRDIEKAIKLDSTKAKYYMLYADINFAGMNIPGSEECFNKALVIEPQNVDALLKLSELYLYIKKYGESLKNADAALKIDKHRAKGYFIKGFVFKENKDTAKAISSFETAVEQQPGYYDAYLQLGILYAAHRDPLAASYYDRALKLQPNSTEVYYDRGLFYQDMGELDKAISDYNELLKIEPNYANAYYNLGYIESTYRKNYAKAIEFYTQAIAKNKYYTEAFFNRGACYELLGDKQKAKEDYHAALAIFPTYKMAQERLKALGS